MTAPLTVMFWPESAYGPTNQCIGVAAKLRDRGHTIVFAAESSWAGKIERYGFIEELVDLAEPAADGGGDDAGQFWTDFIAETSPPEFAKPTIEQLETFILPTYQALIDGAKYCEPRLREIIAKHRPDVIVEDNVVIFPALVTAGKPFVRIVSCSPLEVPGADVPPPFSGLPSDDRSQWGGAYRAEFDRVLRPLWADFDAWVQAQGAGALPTWSSCRATTPEICTSTPPPRPTTPTAGPPSTGPGPDWIPASARPTRTTSCPPPWRTGRTAVP